MPYFVSPISVNFTGNLYSTYHSKCNASIEPDDDMVGISLVVPGAGLECHIGIDYLDSNLIEDIVEIIDGSSNKEDRFALPLRKMLFVDKTVGGTIILNPSMTIRCEASHSIVFCAEGQHSGGSSVGVEFKTNGKAITMMARIISFVGGLIENRLQHEAEDKRQDQIADNLLESMQDDAERPSSQVLKQLLHRDI